MSTQVDTRYGSVGGQDDDGLVVFRGVPFAAPPIGPRRFRAPEPPEPWNGVRPALRFSLPAPQLDDMPLHGFDISRTSEDCLYLNVWTPNTEGARPVMVWIHGGAFAVGSSSQPLFDGATLARRGDVVVVSMNYRIGALGFLHLDAEGFAANCGLLDQLAALEWVRDNIAGFGGDPTSVTVFGESAGAMSIGCLLGSPRPAGLFARAILQSGSVGRIPGADEAAEVADRFLATLDIDRSRLDRLSAVPVEDILAAQRQVRDEFRPPRPLTMPFQPCVDGDLLPRSPLEHIADGGIDGIDLVVGTTRDEWKLFSIADPRLATLDDARLRDRITRQLGAEPADALLTAYRAADPDATAGDVWNRYATDFEFRQPGVRLAETHAARGGTVYTFLFTWESPEGGGGLGACHALDLPFVFGTLDSPGMADFAGTGPDARALAEAVQDAWVSFARTGIPSSPRLPAWPRYDATQRATMLLGATCEVVDDPDGDIRRAWSGQL